MKNFVFAPIWVATVLGMVSCKPQVNTKSDVILKKFKGVNIISVISPIDGGRVSSHILELKDELVVIDSMFARSYAQELQQIIKKIGKPVSRVIVTHSHPDHWFGLEYFKDSDIYALLDTQKEIEKFGDSIIQSRKTFMKDLITDTKVVPNKILEPGEEVIGGVRFIFEKMDGGEASHELLIKLPEQKVLIAQDLAFNKVHLYLGQNDIQNWISITKKLSKLQGYTYILNGHGKPGGMNTFSEMLKYLNDASIALETAKDIHELKQTLLEKYPDYEADFIIDIAADSLFPEK